MSTILDNHFYHKTISLYTAVFGTIFNNLKIKRDDGKIIKVPIAYAGQQKYNARLDQNADPNSARFKARSPRMSYQLVGWNRDSTRVKNQLQTISEQYTPSSTEVSTQLNRVPYTFNYKLDITSKYVDDMLQMLEQIMVFFNPSVQAIVKDNPDLERESSVNITLISSNKNDAFDGTFDESREITATLDFSLDGYLYMPTQTTGIIKKIIINYNDLHDPDLEYDQTIIEEE